MINKKTSAVSSKSKVAKICTRKYPKGTTKKERMKKLEKELDRLWGLVVRYQWDHRCAWPGCNNPGNQPHHFFHKAAGNKARWDTRHGVCLDFAHHIYQVHGKGDVEPIREALIAKIGEDVFEQVKQEVRQLWKPSLEELEELRSKLIVQLTGLGGSAS